MLARICRTGSRHLQNAVDRAGIAGRHEDFPAVSRQGATGHEPRPPAPDNYRGIFLPGNFDNMKIPRFLVTGSSINPAFPGTGIQKGTENYIPAAREWGMHHRVF